jgi:hypothetical protein
MKPGILRNLRIKRVALVDRGANFDKQTGDGAHIMLFKAAAAKSDSLGAVHVDSTDWESDYEKANLNSEQRDKLPDSAFAAVWTDSKGKHRKLPIHDAGHLAAARGRIDQADIPADVKAKARRRIASASQTKEKSMKLKDIIKSALGLIGEPDESKRKEGLEVLTKAADSLPDEMAKAHDPDDEMCKCAMCMAKRAPVDDAVAKRLSDIEKRNIELATELAKAHTTLAAEVEKRESTEMVTMLKSFKHIAVDLATDVAIFRKMKSDSPAAFERTMAMMKANDTQLADAQQFANVGSGMPGTVSGDAWAEIEAKAAQLVAKAGAAMTKAQAIDTVLMDPANQSVVKRYRENAQ